MSDLKWSAELRDRCVQALVSTTKQQCKGSYVSGDSSQNLSYCALGVLATEVLGIPVVRGCSHYCLDRDKGILRSKVLPIMLKGKLIAANDLGASFDELAKIVKEYPVDEE